MKEKIYNANDSICNNFISCYNGNMSDALRAVELKVRRGLNRSYLSAGRGVITRFPRDTSASLFCHNSSKNRRVVSVFVKHNLMSLAFFGKFFACFQQFMVEL